MLQSVWFSPGSVKIQYTIVKIDGTNTNTGTDQSAVSKILEVKTLTRLFVIWMYQIKEKQTRNNWHRYSEDDKFLLWE